MILDKYIFNKNQHYNSGNSAELTFAHLLQSILEKSIEEKINKCNMLIVLVGKNMTTATGAVKEIAFAKKRNVPFFGIYVDDAYSTSNLHDGLQINRAINWKRNSIAYAINQMMKGGKNKWK
ncbi:MAG: TIR domain-containing protein [Mariniphaga sp.]